MSGKTIDDLRATLFATIEAVKSGDMELDKARVINDLARAVTETAKVEVDYLRAAGGGESAFISSAIGADNLPPGLPAAEPGNGVVGVTRHLLRR